jgi:hypothetical protein
MTSLPPRPQVTFDVVDSGSKKVLATVTGTPPQSPRAATVYLIGEQGTTGAFGTKAKLSDDAPEK